MARTYWYVGSDLYAELEGLRDAKTSAYDNGASVKAYMFESSALHALDAAAAVDKGGGEVGIPITGHTLIAGGWVRFAGPVNYQAYYEIQSQTTDEIVITATYVAETFTASMNAFRGVVNGCNITLAYIGSSDGDYDGVLPKTMLLVKDTTYELFIDVVGTTYKLTLKYSRTAVYYPNTD